MKKCLTVFVLCYLLAIPVGAANEQNSAQAVSPYEAFISDFFLGQQELYTIEDVNGNDISDQFYATNLANFLNKDFEAIKNSFTFGRMSKAVSSTLDGNTARRGNVPFQESEERYAPVEATDGSGFSGEFLYTITGTYIYNTDSRRITSGSASVTVRPPVFGAGIDAEVLSADGSVSIASNGQSVIFSGRVEVGAAFYADEEHTIFLGYKYYTPATGSFTAYPPV